jgi:hypothetical protein
LTFFFFFRRQQKKKKKKKVFFARDFKVCHSFVYRQRRIRYGIVGSTCGSHPQDPGSIPGGGTFALIFDTKGN